MNAWALFAFLWFAPASEVRDISKEPHITSQKSTKDGGREIWVHNPLNQAVWLYFECENIISLEPVGVPARLISEIHLKSNESDTVVKDNTCYISKWQIQEKGGVP